MTEAASLTIRRTVWFASVLFLGTGSLILVFGIGWSAVEVWAGLGTGSAAPALEYGRMIFATSCVAIMAGLGTHWLFQRLEREEAATVEIDLDRPVVGYHAPEGSADRWRIEGRVSVRVRRSFTATVQERTDYIARAAAEALSVMGPRAAFRLDRTRAEYALAELVNRAIGSRTVRSVQIRQVRLQPAR